MNTVRIRGLTGIRRHGSKVCLWTGRYLALFPEARSPATCSEPQESWTPSPQLRLMTLHYRAHDGDDVARVHRFLLCSPLHAHAGVHLHGHDHVHAGGLHDGRRRSLSASRTSYMRQV